MYGKTANIAMCAASSRVKSRLLVISSSASRLNFTSRHEFSNTSIIRCALEIRENLHGRYNFNRIKYRVLVIFLSTPWATGISLPPTITPHNKVHSKQILYFRVKINFSRFTKSSCIFIDFSHFKIIL